MKKIFFWFACLFFVASTSSETVKCKSPSCKGENCEGVECGNGECTEDGFCECEPCWNGKTCQLYQNLFYPNFEEEKVKVKLNKNTKVGSVIHVLKAIDNDLRTTCSNNTLRFRKTNNTQNSTKCDCGIILYNIESGNENGFFKLDKFSGEVSLAEEILSEDFETSLYVSAVNQEVKGFDVTGPVSYMAVYIFKGNPPKQASEVMDDSKRYRRAVPDTVGNLTLTFNKIGENNESTEIYVGTVYRFQLQIQFPPNVDTILSVELFTAYNLTTIMVLCKPEITFSGGNLAYDSAGAVPYQDANDGSLNYDRAVFNLGTVSNSGGGVGMESVMLIEFEAFMISSSDLVNGTYYWVSAGAEYNNQNEIWISQIGFLFIMDNYEVSSLNPKFNLTGPNEIPQGAAASFTLDMYLPYPAINLNFDLFAPFNYTDAITICSVLVVDVGEHYECYNYKDLQVQFYDSESTLTKERATLPMGMVVNKGSRLENAVWDENRITLMFVITVSNDDLFLNQNLWIGATLEIGINEIWAIQHSFKVVPAVPAAALVSAPSLSLETKDTTNNINLGIPKVIHLNITLDQNTISGYVLEAQTDGVKVALCSSMLAKKGKNVPCFTPTSPILTKSLPELAYNNLVWNMGTLENMLLVNDASEDNIDIALFISLINYAGVNTGDSVSLSGKIIESGGLETPFSQAFTVGSLIANSTATNYSVPTFNISYAMGSITPYINETIDLRLTITFYPQALNIPFTIKFISSNSTSITNDFNLVRAEVLSVGKNFPCTSQYTVNSSAYYSSLIDHPTDDHVGVSIDFGNVINLADLPTNGFVPTKDDKIEVRAVLFVKDTSASATLETYVTYADYEPAWQDTQSFTIGTSLPLDYNETLTIPVFFDYSNTELTSAFAGSVYKRQIIIKTPPKSVATWQIIADTLLDPDLSICAIKLVNYGYDIPYIDKNIPTSKLSVGGGNEKGWIEIHAITNIEDTERLTNSTFDQSSVVFEVLVKVFESSALQTKKVNLSVDHGLNGIDHTADASFVVVALPTLPFSAGAVVLSENFTMAKVNENSSTPTNNVYLGQTFIVTTALEYPNLTVNEEIQVTIQAPADGSVKIVQYGLIFAGQNFPCVQKGIHATYTMSNNRADLSLGFVTHMVTNDSSIESQLIVEAVVTIVRNSGKVAGDTINLVHTTNINGTDLTPITLPLTIVASPPADRDFNYQVTPPFEINGTDVVPSLEGNRMAYINATITITPNTSDTITLVVGPISSGTNGAYMTIEDVGILSWGKNLGSVEDPLSILPTYFPPIFSQKTTAVLTFDKITNTGHSHRAWTYEEGDDDIVLEVLIRMADDILMTNGLTYQCPFSATYLDLTLTDNVLLGFITETSSPILLNITADVNFLTVYNEGDKIPITMNISHATDSLKEAIQFKLGFYLTPYLKLDTASFVCNYNNTYVPTPLIYPGVNSFLLEFPAVFFTDHITMYFELEYLPGIFPYTTTQTVKIVYETSMILPNSNSKLYMTPMETISFNLAGGTLSLCPNEIALGMQSGLITDCQITGSPGENDYIASRHGSTGWNPGVRQGNYERFLKIHFGDVTRVTKITLTQLSGDKMDKFRIDFSHDGIKWMPGQTFIAPNTATPTDFKVDDPIDATYTRIFIVSTFTPDTAPMFTIELYGCVIYNYTAKVPCNVRNGVQPPAPNSLFKKRMLAEDGTKVYVCDMMPNFHEMKCFASADGQTWQVLDPSVYNVLGYCISKSRLYGLHRNMVSYMMSLDGGLTWLSVSEANYLADSADPADFLFAADVPWNRAIDATPVVKGAFSGKFDGLYYNGAKVANWMDCCSG